MARPDELTADAFEPHIGTMFEVALDDEGLPPIRLDEVLRLGAQPTAPRPDPFSLVFTGDPPVMEQRIYALSHAAIGSVQLFLVPIGLEPGGRVRYEAVFN